MKIPKLDPSGRDREYKLRTFDQVSQIVHAHLFSDNTSHRDMDREILDLDPTSSKGWQSMGVLHYLGLKKEFKGLFADTQFEDAIQQLQNNQQDFALIIELLENTQDNSSTSLIESLYETGRTQDSTFEENYRLRLQEFGETDGTGNQILSRKEQGLLRTILFKKKSEVQCAICHRMLPTDLLVAAHIKPRSKCTTSERKNPNVVMPVCKVGCDDFFEKGYLTVNEEGTVLITNHKNVSQDLVVLLKQLEGNKCTHFNEDTANFFAFKREIISL